MEKVTLQKQNLTPYFIGSWIINPLSICDELIAYFELNKKKQTKGVTADGENLESKNSTDITIQPKDIKCKTIKVPTNTKQKKDKTTPHQKKNTNKLNH